MSKRVPMVLSKSISKLGKIGDLVEVAPGYARNYLLPQKLAVIATSSILKQVEQRKEKESQRLLLAKQVAEEQKVCLSFEAAVAGAIPILKNLKEGLVANEINKAVKTPNTLCIYFFKNFFFKTSKLF